MNTEKFDWKDEYNIGVENIDQAHQEFFRIARRVHLTSQSKVPNPWAAQEGIKFLKAYVNRHFQEEEAYMAQIGYKDLELHHAQHEHLKTKVVPRVEAYLHAHGQTREAVGKFMEILSLWMKRHILMHDKAIAWQAAVEAESEKE